MLKDTFPEEPPEDLVRSNEELVERFKVFLEEKDLRELSVEKYVYNVSYFLDEYLLPRKKRPEEALQEMDAFIGNWFIKKTPWATMSSIQAMIRSLQNFYQFLLQEGRISKEQLEQLQNKMRRSYKGWVARLNATNY